MYTIPLMWHTMLNNVSPVLWIWAMDLFHTAIILGSLPLWGVLVPRSLPICALFKEICPNKIHLLSSYSLLLLSYYYLYNYKLLSSYLLLLLSQQYSGSISNTQILHPALIEILFWNHGYFSPGVYVGWQQHAWRLLLHRPSWGHQDTILDAPRPCWRRQDHPGLFIVSPRPVSNAMPCPWMPGVPWVPMISLSAMSLCAMYTCECRTMSLSAIPGWWCLIHLPHKWNEGKAKQGWHVTISRFLHNDCIWHQ